MNDRETNTFDALVRMREFDERNRADYKQFADAATHFAVVRTVIDALESQAAKQASGARRQAVEQKSVLKAALKRKLKDISRTARALNFDDAGFRRLFSIPEGSGEQKLLAAAREFAEQAAKRREDFLRFGMPASFVEDLTADIAAFESAANQKAGAQGANAGATAEIDAQIERAMESATILNAIMQNVYRDNAQKLAEWTTARRIRRSPSKQNAPAQPPKL